ncbi:MAG TPA: metal ABC transporter permease [Candidatus Paceibacterota bacterium]
MAETQFLLNLLAALSVGGATGYLGSLVVTKRMSLVGDALGHVALPGVALGILFGFNIIFGAFAALALGIIFIWLLEGKTTLPTEALTGIIFTGSLAAAFLLLPNEDLESALIGDISNITTNEAILTVILACAVFLLARRIFSSMILITLSPDLAKSMRVAYRAYNFLYLFSIGVIVALGIKFVGALLVGALIIIPAAAARNLSNTMRQYSYGSLALGAISSVLGITIFKFTHIPAGPAVVLIAIFFFLITLVMKK